MTPKSTTTCWAATLALVLGASACETKHEGQVERVVRPVTVMTLTETSPARDSRRVGLVMPFREEQVGFEVGGRVLITRDAGSELVGPVLDESNQLVRAGDVIAMIDSTRYLQDLRGIEAKIASRQASLEAQRIEVNEVARSERDLAKVTFQRQRSLFDSGAASQELLDEAKSRLDVAEATLRLKAAQVTAGEAEVADLRQSLEEAQLNLSDCVLRAPFTGRITALHVARGALVSPGQPVVTITVFDPIKVAVAVSAVDDRRIGVGAMAQVLPTSLPQGLEQAEPCQARVKEKSQVAEASTRTFDVELITRNRRYPSTGKQWLRQGRFIPAIPRHAGEAGPLYVGLTCVVYEGEQAYVYLLEDVNFWDDAEGGSDRLITRKVPVELGERYWSILGWNLRELKGTPLNRDAVLVNEPARWNLREGPLELTRYEWLLRPGDIVNVEFQLGQHPPGFYVPVSAIRELNGSTSALLVVDGEARAVPVEVHQSYLDMRRISGPDLAAGAELIVQGAHFVVHGERVSTRPEAPR